MGVGGAVRGVGRAVGRAANATTMAAGAVGGAAVNGVVGAVQGAAAGVQRGLASGSHSTPAAALTLGALGVTGLVEWPLVLAIGGTALVLRQLSLNPWMGDFVLPSTRLFWDAAECGAVGRG
ncbi:hypothetical protein [Mycobacterium xenopi]|uniref:hypothetical protein n=1 Tax=Mycobacterium xenopi TaxID=1789 RepID=UPI003A599356